MSKQSAVSASTHAPPRVTLLLSNLRLLDLNRRDDWPSITLETFTCKNTLQNEKARIQCVEWAFYRLFEIWDPVETKDKLAPFFPALVPLQSLNLRAALFRSLNELKKNGLLGKDVIVRKSFFDDCKGERIQELLVSLSTLVLRKVLTAGHGGRPCIAARLATAKNVTAKEQQSLLPLAIAHRASLTAVLQRKKDLRERYKKFGHILDAKEQELDRRFEAVVSTQEVLDQNSIPDHTVARVAKLFDKNWQGDRKPVDFIMQSDEQGMKDTLLDKPFSETWLQVSAGTFDEGTGTSGQSLLQDLEERVANQEARLTDWRKFKEAMRRDGNVTPATKTTTPGFTKPRSKGTDRQMRKDLVSGPRNSPRKSNWIAGNEASPTHPKRSRKEDTQDELRERDLVFSPRKSPRKSVWPVHEFEAETSSAYSQAATKQETGTMTTRNEIIDDVPKTPVRRQLFRLQGDNTRLSPVSPVDDTDESGFSEISSGELHLNEPQDHTVAVDSHLLQKQCSDQNPGSSTKSESKNSETKYSDTSTTDSNPVTPDDDDSWISSLPVEDNRKERTESQSLDEDDKLAEQIVSMTINAAPTPAKPKISLMERTRQSMAFASPTKLQSLLPEGPSSMPTIPPIATQPPSPATGPTSLLERTRQSISLVPSSKLTASRKSTQGRRTSHRYPTNQFETPKRQLDRVTESMTPPEELFSPGAGYDSVFKSRPKIALSPNPSPRYDGSDDVVEGGGSGRRGESRLTRMVA